MTAIALGSAVGATVALGFVFARPAPQRTRLGQWSARQLPQGAADRAAELVGIFLIRAVRGRRHATARAAAKRVGAAAFAAVVTAVVLPASLAPVSALLAYLAPALRARRRARARLAAFEDDLPDVVDLLVLAAGAGWNVHLSVEAVGRRGSGPLACELRRATGEIQRGKRLADALEELPARCGESIRPLVSALCAGERYGIPLATSLGRMADEVRAAQRRRGEEAARRIPVALLFPLVLCILPAFGLLTVAPLLVTAIRSLQL